jgi:hypothetical protein
VVKIVFVDADSGDEIANTDLPAEHLPDEFQRGMTVFIEGSELEIDRADPASKVEFTAIGRLTLAVRRVERIDSSGILFSLPTIYEELPEVDDSVAVPTRLAIHEDDWRRVEFVHRSVQPIVMVELDQVRRVYAESSRRDAADRVIGFTAIHRRKQPSQPLPVPISVRQLGALVPPSSGTYAGFGYRGSVGIVPGGFAEAFGSVVLYGRAVEDAIAELCLSIEPDRPDDRSPAFAEALALAMGQLELLLVDWTLARLVEPAAIGGYLADVGVTAPS